MSVNSINYFFTNAIALEEIFSNQKIKISKVTTFNGSRADQERARTLFS